MTSPNFAIVFSAVTSGTTGSGSAGDVLIPSATSGLYVKATSGERGTRRSTGIALGAYANGSDVEIQQFGQVDATTAGLGAGTASWVRVSAAGVLERVAPSGSDDLVGWVETTGVFHACFGFLTAAIANGGSGTFTAPTGTGFCSVTAGVLDVASIKVNLASSTYVTGILADTNGGTGIAALGSGVATWFGTPSGANLAAALTSALPDSKGGTGLTALAAGVATWLGTPSGANLASALTSALPDTKGGTGLTALGSGVATWLGTPSGANLASALTSALPDTKGGTGLTGLGGGVATFLGTPTSANLLTVLSTSSTGTGNCVFGTAPLFKTTINLNNPGDTFKYVITPAAIAADRILNLPLLTGTDTVAVLALAQALTNKTIDCASNTVSNVVNATVSSSAAIVYSKLGTTGTETIVSQQFDTNINAKGTLRTVEPKNVQTTDATVTTLDSFTLASNTGVVWTAVVTAVKSDKSQAAAYIRTACFRNNAGTVAQVSTTQDGGTFEDDSTWDCTLDFTGTTCRIRVTGKAATTVQWTCTSQRLEVIS